MATVQQVYTRVCDVLMEPLGLTTDVYTEAQFLLDVWQVVGDFAQRTGMTRLLINLPVTAGTSAVGYPDYAMDVQEVFYDDRFLHRESGFSLDNLERQWRSRTSSRPERWHEDRLPVKTVQLQPIPTISGSTVTMTAPLYGTISVTATPVTFDLATTAALYGTISATSGPIFVEMVAPLYGTISEIVDSTMNATLVGTVRPLANSYALGDSIDWLPDSFVSYVAYGVLAKVFSRDGETRDAIREKYATARFGEGLALAKAFADEASDEGSA